MARPAKKQSLYFPEEIVAEMQAQASRLDRSLSWVVQQAWLIAREEISKMEAPAKPGEAPAKPGDATKKE